MLLKLAETVYGDEEIDAMKTVIDSGNYTMGNNVKKFEDEFAKKFGFKYCVMVNSGSSANLLSMSVLTNPKRKVHLNKGDRVLIPTVCWATSVFPLLQVNLIPVFMDSSSKTLNIIAEDIEKYENIRGIMLVHILGNSTNMEKVMEIVNKKNLLVMEDTCESLSSKFNTTYLGGFGDMGTFSFYFSHHMTTVEGGMVCCKTEEDYELLKVMRGHGWSKYANHHEEYKNISNKFCFINFGYNIRPMEIQGAMGLVQLKNLDYRNKKRKYNYSKITNTIKNHLNNWNIIDIMVATEGCYPEWFAIPLLVNSKYNIHMKEYIKYLDDNGIENRPIVTGNFTRQPVMQLIDKTIDPTQFTEAEKIHFNGFYIGCPTHKFIDDNEVNMIVSTLLNFDKFKNIIPFFDKPYNIQKSIPYVNDAIESTWISLGGKYVDLCEEKLKIITGCDYVILTLTGTAAIQCMVKCLKYKYPHCNKIYIPNNTYIACINVLLHEFNFEQIECLDVDIDTLNIENVDKLEKNAALFVIHNVAGITNIPKIKRNRPDLLIFEDNSEGYFGEYEGQPTGSASIASSLSFNMNKNLTSGQGGAFCTNDRELYDYISSYTRHGFTGEKFHYMMVGNNFRMTNISAAILLSQIEQSDEILNEKKNMYKLYKKYLPNSKNIELQKINGDTKSSYWYLVVRIKDNNEYSSVNDKLLKCNIDTRPMFLPIQGFNHLMNLKHNTNTNSYKIHNEYIFLPFNNINENTIKYICSCLSNI